jgi:hypothetical protein
MKMPWHNQTGLAKAGAISATLFLISSGLCGGNFALFLKFGSLGGGVPPPDRPAWATSLLMITGFLELAVIALSAVGVIVVLVIAIARAIKNHFAYN